MERAKREMFMTYEPILGWGCDHCGWRSDLIRPEGEPDYITENRMYELHASFHYGCHLAHGIEGLWYIYEPVRMAA